MIEYRSPNTLAEILMIYDQVDEQFGEQYHPRPELLLTLAKNRPEQIVMAFEQNKLVGHTVVLPLSDEGRIFFFDPDAPESDLSEKHLVFKTHPEIKVHFFVYSILAKKKVLAFSMIQKLVNAAAIMAPHSHPESTFIGEVVSSEGKKLAHKLGMSFHHSYLFEGDEEVFIYQNQALETVKAFAKYGSYLKDSRYLTNCNFTMSPS